MSFNRFIGGTQSELETPVAEVEGVSTESETETESESNIDPLTGKKKRKSSKPRDKKNTTITKAQKEEILKRYADESPAAIAADMGLESRQVYNVVRNTKLKLEESIKTCQDPARKALLEQALAKIPQKESGSAPGGARANTMTEDDIIASLLG